MSYHDQQPEKEALSRRLQKLFDLRALSDLELITGGFLCQNFTLRIGAQRFFLKQYRHKLSQVVHQVKYAEDLFAAHGVPVLSPLKDRFGRGAFYLDRNWYSLFPFIDRKAISIQELTNVGRETLARQLAKMHQIGRAVKKSIQPLLLWDRRCKTKKKKRSEEAGLHLRERLEHRAKSIPRPFTNSMRLRCTGKRAAET